VPIFPTLPSQLHYAIRLSSETDDDDDDAYNIRLQLGLFRDTD